MDTRTAIWEARADAKRLRGYYGSKVDRYARHCRLLSGLAFVAGSAAVAASLKAWWPWLGPALTVVVTVVAGFFPVVQVHLWRLECEMAQSHWVARERVWDTLWLEAEVGVQPVTLERVNAERAEDGRFRLPSCPMDAVLAASAEAATYRALGVGTTG